MQVSVAKNTVTNYLVILVRTFQGLLVTRWLVNYLGDSGYGLWTLLWTFFGYALLMDFGAGIAGQKYTSQELFKRDIRHYNSIISMIFTFHSMMVLLIILGVFIASFYLEKLFNVHDPEQLAYCRKCFFTFSLGSAVIFPLCLFSEIMVGLHKIYFKNYIDTVFRISELIGFLVILKLGGDLFGIIVFVLVLMAVERSFTGFCVSRFIPGFRLRFFLFDRQVFREVFGFSSGTYFVSMAKLLRTQTRNPIISKYCGLDSVGIFNLSNRLSDLCNQAISQYNANVRPVTAQLFHRGRFRMLREFIVKSMQWNMFMCCLFIIPAIMLRDEAIFALFKKSVTPLIHDLSLLSLLGAASWLVMTQIPSSVLLMCERHHLLAWTSMAEAVTVVVLNILFLRAGKGLVCIELISLGASFVLFAVVRFPIMLKLIHGRAVRELFCIYVPSLLAAVPAVAVLYLCKRLLLGHVHEFLLCAICGTVYAVIYVLTAWQFLIGRTKKELWKRRVMIRVRKYLKKA
ncbi:MAG: oligosaccharide flippase family protein [Lentisphaeria bacterium]|nr:oligosaccharide flippase family protein [Lentisphaeria bacterium]